MAAISPFEQALSVLQQQQQQPENDNNYPSTYFSSASPAAEGPTDNSYLLETFHQYPHGDFRPTFYNPFEIKHRRRTSRAQLKILEKSFSENPKPSAAVRRMLAQRFDMTPRGVQIWFQNRRAKAKLLRRKSNVLQQQQQMQQLTNQNSSSDEREEDEEEDEEYSSSPSNTSKKRKSINNKTGDQDERANNKNLSQSSILFSQFFSNAHPQSFSMEENFHDNSNLGVSNSHSNWQHHQQRSSSLIDNARSIATVAAATAVAISTNISTQQFEPNILSSSLEQSSSNWSSSINNNTAFSSHQQNLQSYRRLSCPMPDIDKSVFQSAEMDLQQHVHHSRQDPVAFLSPSSWSPSMVSQSNRLVESTRNASPMLSFGNFKRHFSFDATNSTSLITSMDTYPLQDIHLTSCLSQQQHQQLTPPLTASCSASTIAGSPIALDTLYNDPVVVPPHHQYAGYYRNRHSRISSPLSTTILMADTTTMPSFV